MNRKQRRAAGLPAASAADPDPKEMFAAALRQHRAGQTEAAERAYRAVLAVAPRHAECLYMLGVLALQTRRPALAVEQIGQAIAADATQAQFHANFGIALHQLGRTAEAIASLRQAIALRPELADAHSNLSAVLNDAGEPAAALASARRALALRPAFPAALNNLSNALLALRRHDEAVACARQSLALQPDAPETLNTLANALLHQGAASEAVSQAQRALALRPNHLFAHITLGNACKRLGRLEDAAAAFGRALALQPDFTGALNNLGATLRELGRLDEAAACYQRALELAPGLPEAHCNLANVLLDRGQAAAAEAAARRALALRPAFAVALNSLGNAVKLQGRLDEAAACYARALDLAPDYHEAHNNLGNVRLQQRRLAEARACYHRAVALAPGFADAQYHLAMLQLLLGEMPAGWHAYDEWRWRVPKMHPRRHQFSEPQWRGEAAAGRTLLIHAEQGFGDTLQFCRFATVAAARGLRVILHVQPALVRLLRSLEGPAEVLGYDAPPPACDLHCPMLSLPAALGTTLASIPCAASYLAAAPAQVALWRDRMAAMARPGRRVGLVWAGNPRLHLAALAAVDHRRSMPPACLAPLAALGGLHLVSLQQGGPPPPEGLALTDVMAEMADFADTAALIANLDLVISVDTAVAHLAAALGKPVWLLDRFDACWRWLDGRRDSPWYPSLRIYRQPQPGDWDAVMAAVVADLRRLP